MVLHNPNNWHWVNKDAREWAKQYVTEKVCAVSAEENGVSAKIARLLTMDGDVDVNQRKGKVITLFDVRVQLEYEGSSALRRTISRCNFADAIGVIGKNKDGEDVSGTITIPEVAHDTEEDEYVVCSLSPVFSIG